MFFHPFGTSIASTGKLPILNFSASSLPDFFNSCWEKSKLRKVRRVMLLVRGCKSFSVNCSFFAMPSSRRGASAGFGERLGEDLRAGALFVFTDRRHSRLKILYWDGTGLWLLIKRLEKGAFSWPKVMDAQAAKLKLAPEALAMPQGPELVERLTDGIDLRGARRRPWSERE